MNGIARVFVVFALCLAMTGCLGTRITSATPPVTEPKMRMSVTLLWGLKTSNVDTECPGGISRTEVLWPIWGGMIAWVTFLLVVPTYTMFECAGE